MVALIAAVILTSMSIHLLYADKNINLQNMEQLIIDCESSIPLTQAWWVSNNSRGNRMSQLCVHCQEYDIPDDIGNELPSDKEEEYKNAILLLEDRITDLEQQEREAILYNISPNDLCKVLNAAGGMAGIELSRFILYEVGNRKL